MADDPEDPDDGEPLTEEEEKSAAEEELKKLESRALMSLIICVLYIAFGTFIYTSVFEALDAVDALYFTIVTLTTVGYGDICPSSDGSKLFTIAFSFIGVVQIGVAFEVLAEYLMVVKAQLTEQGKEQAEERIDAAMDNTDDKPLPGTRHYGEGTKAIKKLIVPFLWLQTMVMSVTCVQVVGEGDWTLVDGIYFAIITATTVGYGDIAPSTPFGRMMACGYIPVCLAIFTTCLGTIADVYFRLMALNSDSAHLDGLDLTLSELTAMDEDGDGKVSEFEFTKFMLLAMGKLDKEMLDQIDDEFKKLDADGSGYLDMADIQGGDTAEPEPEPTPTEAEMRATMASSDSLLSTGSTKSAKARKKAKPVGVGDTSLAALLTPILFATISTVAAFILAGMSAGPGDDD